MNPVYISVVEGNPHLRSLLSWHLQQAGYLVQQCSGYHQARQAFQHQLPTLAIIDSDLTDGDGIELCR
ncbi:MAG: response regulator, partial [Synechocystis sp.]|nr:response regulator [Synechocystis sp.]